VVPTTRPEAHDKVFCLDAATGDTLWQKEFPGVHTQYSSSATPCVVDGRCYVNGSGGSVWCLDAADGSVVWESKAPGYEKGNLASSFVVCDGLAILLSGQLTAFHVTSGQVAWVQPEVTGEYGSAAYWRHKGSTYLVCNGAKETFCLEPSTGRIVWRVQGGGWCTPTIVDDRMVVYAMDAKIGLVAYELVLPSPRKLWNVAGGDRGSSPIIHDGHVYAMGGRGSGRAVCVNLATGEVRWEQRMVNVEIASPVLADGRLLYVMGRSFSMIDALPDGYRLQGKADLRLSPCVTPAVVDGMVYLRLPDKVACYDLRAPAAGDAPAARAALDATGSGL
jgi:outer membrane protein assembly factor BamB